MLFRSVLFALSTFHYVAVSFASLPFRSSTPLLCLDTSYAPPLCSIHCTSFTVFTRDVPTLQTHAALAFLSIKSLRKFQHKHTAKHRTLKRNSPDIDKYIQCGTLNCEADYLQFTIPVKVECGKTKFAFLL